MSIDRITKAIILFLLTFPILIGLSNPVVAQQCTLIVDAQTDATIKESGTCDSRYTAASTFKIALALMGYDAGILTDGHTPLLKWREGMRAPMRDRKPVDPRIWQADSVLWFSREVTRNLGAERLSSYVKKFDYGNKDISGELGKGNGLSHAWITSLAISPREQINFIRRMLAYDLPVSRTAISRTMEIVPRFTTKSGWLVHGKTGSGWTRDRSGQINRDQPEGWFVGWAERDGRIIVFARLGVGTVEGRQGLIEQRTLLAALEDL